MAAPVFLGVEIGGTKLQLGLGAGDGRISSLRRLAVAPEAGAIGVRAQIEAAVVPMLAEAGMSPSDLAAVGIGFGGPVDAARGVVTRSFQVAGWAGFALADWVRSTLGVPVVSVHNDADTAALGEARFGAGAGLSPVLYVNSGSGVGGGLIVDGQIYRGSGAGAMEIGHLVVIEEMIFDNEGDYCTLEQVASGWSIGDKGRRLAEQELHEGRDVGPLVRWADGRPESVTAETVARAARANPGGEAAEVLRQATLAMGRALAHAVTLLAPRRVILGGGVSLMDDELWIDPIRRALERRVFPPFRGTFDLVPAALGEEVVVHGALALARDAARLAGSAQPGAQTLGNS